MQFLIKKDMVSDLKNARVCFMSIVWFHSFVSCPLSIVLVCFGFSHKTEKFRF